MSPPSISVVLVCVYAACLLVVAVAFDRLGARSALRSASWRHGNFLYHEDADAWKCHEDQWLWPTSFDPEKRVIRYAGQHAICGRCPAKAECSPTPGPRELTRNVDPWPHSEAGRFHRGVSVAIAAVALMMVLAMLLFGATDTADVILLLAALALVLAVGIPLSRHLWNTPDGFPEHLVLETPEEDTTGVIAPDGTRKATLSTENVDAVLARHRRGAGAGRTGGSGVPGGAGATGGTRNGVALPTPRYRSDRLDQRG
ncbi:hypothetical protein [Piscicoccus intestinalis]|uniref:hypothetical protein n=1 Tax=Piscicoccus intestinalis TaxID=746033 RepID=UPI000A890185|nr:hypothetical protein [Piscicoccus intestinalis]